MVDALLKEEKVKQYKRVLGAGIGNAFGVKTATTPPHKPQVLFGKEEEVDEEVSVDEPEPRVSLNKTYKFMSIDHLQTFKRQYFKSVNQLILRIYKSIFALFLLYPELNDFASAEHSLFDKMYQMQMISHCFAQKNQGNLNEIMKMELPVPMSFEGDIEKLLGGPGIKVKPMHEI